MERGDLQAELVQLGGLELMGKLVAQATMEDQGQMADQVGSFANLMNEL